MTQVSIVRSILPVFLLVSLSEATFAESKKIIVDQDARGPATTDMQSILMFAQSPAVDVLGITLVAGDQPIREQAMHTLRALELVGRDDIPVVVGAEFPLLNSREETLRWESIYGNLGYKGEWDKRYARPPSVPYPMPEGFPSTEPLDQVAANFIIETVRAHPGEVTIWSGGPLTNIAIALRLDPELPKLAKELVVVGGGFNVDRGGIHNVNGRREFNWWFDPEAARIVLGADWNDVTITPVDISVKASLTEAIKSDIARADTPLASYHTTYARAGSLMWDEISAAAVIEPGIITETDRRLVNVDIDHGEGYGQTIFVEDHVEAPDWFWKPATVQVDLDLERFYRLYAELMSGPPLRGLSSVRLEAAPNPAVRTGTEVATTAGTSSGRSSPTKVFVDMDAYSSSPVGTDIHSLLALLQSPDIEVVGISVTSGDGWAKSATLNVLRLLELTGHDHVPVAQGAEYALINTCEESRHWERKYGVMAYKGVCSDRMWHNPDEIVVGKQGATTLKPVPSHGANFLIEKLREHPGEVVVWAGGPLTTLALAIAMAPEVPTLAKEFVHMGAGFNVDRGGNFRINGRLEFNWWWDPEAARIVMRAPWRKITLTPVDISVKTDLSDEIKEAVRQGSSPAARYLGEYWGAAGPVNYMWDEISAIALIHPDIITKQRQFKVNVAIDHGALYGQTIFLGHDTEAPAWFWRSATVLEDLDLEKFNQIFIDLMKLEPTR